MVFILFKSYVIFYNRCNFRKCIMKAHYMQHCILFGLKIVDTRWHSAKTAKRIISNTFYPIFKHLHTLKGKALFMMG